MSDPGSLEVIFGAGSDQTVLGVDFPHARGTEAGFAELARGIGSGYRFLQTKPPTVLPGQRVSVDSYVRPWIDDIQRDAHAILAVLGYRVGGIYAAAIVQEISRWCPQAKVILFDPQFSSIRLLGLELLREIDAISSLLTDDEIERAKKSTAEVFAARAGDVAAVAVEVIAAYREISTIAFERVGLGGFYLSDLMVPFQSRISWISTADQIDPGPAWANSTAIVSTDFDGLPNGDPRAIGADGPIGRKIFFEVENSDLLRSNSVAKNVIELLES